MASKIKAFGAQCRFRQPDFGVWGRFYRLCERSQKVTRGETVWLGGVFDAVAQAYPTKRCPTARPSRCNLPGDSRLRYKLSMSHQHSVQTHLGTAADDYDRVIRTFIPGYEQMLSTIGWWLSEVIPPDGQVRSSLAAAPARSRTRC